MSNRILIATFDNEENLLAGCRAARAHGIRILDAFTPYPVHGLDQAMGLAPSRLAWVCGGLGLSAAVFMTWFQFWASAADWPINIGGKPWNSLPAFAPVIFESMVLCAGLGTVLAFLLVAGLWPGKKAKLASEGVTNDRFALVVAHSDAARDLEEMRRLLAASQPIALEERVACREQRMRAGEGGRIEEPPWLGLGNAVLLAVLVVLIAANVFVPRNLARPNWELFSEMVRTPAYSALAENPSFPDQATQQAPLSGTIPQGRMPLHYRATDEDAAAAGRELTNPFSADDPQALERGQHVFQTYCAACHGGGNGDGPVALRGFPAPPPFATGQSREMADGQLFHILTYGRGNMPSHAALVSRDDRWKAILHVRRLQQQAAAAAPEAGGQAAPSEETRQESPPIAEPESEAS